MYTIHTLRFGVRELIPYINWIYFFHAWGVKEENAEELKQEANELLDRWACEGRETVFRVRLFRANSSDDDVLLYDKARDENVMKQEHIMISFLRQQRSPFLCLADFLPPVGMEPATMGIFASSVPFQVEELIEQTLADRLAEASAELGHEIVRKTIWGYAPEESLTPKEMFAERYQGKRPAVGYPSMPDQSMNFVLARLLDFETMGISLTENGAMIPHASTSGVMISHPKCQHFKVGAIGEDQLKDYACRRRMQTEELRRFLEIV